MGIYTTRLWQTSGRLVQELDVYTVNFNNNLRVVTIDTVRSCGDPFRRNEHGTTAVDAAEVGTALEGDLPGVCVAGGLGSTNDVSSSVTDTLKAGALTALELFSCKENKDSY